MEYLETLTRDTDVSLIGYNLVGDVDFMHRNTTVLYPQNPELATLFTVKTDLLTADTSTSTVEATTTIIIRVYNHEKNLDVRQLYGLFCYGVIFNYMHLTNIIRDKGILRNGEPYKPTVMIPNFEEIETDLLDNIKRAYKA